MYAEAPMKTHLKVKFHNDRVKVGNKSSPVCEYISSRLLRDRHTKVSGHIDEEVEGL